MKEHNDISRTSFRSLYAILVVASLLGSCVILYHSTHTPTYTIDSYFYLSKAKQLADGHGLRTTWNDGVDAKYFPGYSVFLALPFLIGASYVPLQIISYLLCVIVLFAITRELELESAEQTLATTAFVANPIVIKWFALPMAEGVALALSLLSVLLFLRFARTKASAFLVAACAVGGVAVITRLEALFLLGVFAAIILPKRNEVSRLSLFAGIALFLLPLAVYWVRIRFLGLAAPAYLGEFRHTFLRFPFAKNLAYNLWVPFGFMHSPAELLGRNGARSVAALAGAIWIVLGEFVFIAGLLYSLFGRLGRKVKAISLLFLAYAILHAFWYYRYERFMLFAIPLAAVVWAISLRAIFAFLLGKEGHRRIPMAAQILIAATGVYFGNHYSSLHSMELQQDTSGLQFQHIAEAVNALDGDSRSPVLTDLGPHLAYYLDAHTYMDSGHGNYWQRAFPLGNTLEEIEKRGIRFIVTNEDLASWLKKHKIPSEESQRFKCMDYIDDRAKVVIIKYSPS